MRAGSIWSISLIGITALWGWSFVAIHAALNEISAPSFNAYRFTAGSLAMLPFVYQKLKHISAKQYFHCGMVGLALFFAFTFQTSGIKWTSASNASFITGLAIIFTPLILYVFYKTKPSMKQSIGGVIATIGLGMLTLKGFNIHLGDALVLICAVFTALHVVLLSKVSKHNDAAVLAFLQVAMVAVLSLGWAALDGGLGIPKTPVTYTTILLIGTIGTALAYYVQTKAQVTAPAAKIALILVLEPVFGGIFGYFLGGDRLGLVNVVGACLIVVGMVVTEVEVEALKDMRIYRAHKLKS